MRPRSVRARLVVVYTAAALLVGLAGGLVFTLQLRAGLRTSLDAALDARATPLAASVADGPLPTELADGSPQNPTAVYDPAGAVVAGGPAAVLDPGQLAAARSAPLRLDATVGGVELRLLAVPVTRPDGTWVVGVGADRGAAHEAVDEVDRALEFGGAGILLLAAAGAWLLSGAALRPVDRMRREAAELGAHDSGGRLGDPGTGDELAALAQTFNGLLDRLHRSSARQRDLVADAGHELRTPLAVLRTELELADRPGRDRAELADAVAHARIEVERLSRLADDLLYLARADGTALAVDRRKVELCPVLTEAARACRAVAGGVAVAVDVPYGLAAEVDPYAIRRAVDNLLANALRAAGPDGSVRVRAALHDGRLQVAVSDSGPGFPPDFLPHAFERFRVADPSRTSAAGGGAGLGLAIVAEIAAAHGGTAAARDLPDGGAEVRLDLPAAR